MEVLIDISNTVKIPWKFPSRLEFFSWFNWAMSRAGVVAGNNAYFLADPTVTIAIDECPKACPILFLPSSQ